MISWITDNIGTVAASGILAAVIVAVFVKIIRDKRQGKSSCGCNCAHCAMADSCHKTK